MKKIFKNAAAFLYWAQLDMENYSFEYLHTSSNKEYEFFYYNDFDDYEDEIESSSSTWVDRVLSTQ